MLIGRELDLAGMIARTGDVLAGYVMIYCYYRYGGTPVLNDVKNVFDLEVFRDFGTIAALFSSAILLYGARNLWRAVYMLELRRPGISASRRGQATRPFLLASVMCGCGILAAMSAGMTSFVCACVIASLSLLDSCVLLRFPMLSALASAAIRVVSVLLGMSVYPMLTSALDNPSPLLLAVLTGLFCCGALLAVPPRDKDTSPVSVVSSAIAVVFVTIAALYATPSSPFVFWVLAVVWVVVLLGIMQGLFGRRGNNGLTWAAVAESALPLLQGAVLCGFAAEWGWDAGKYVLIAFGVLFFFSLTSAAGNVSRALR